MPTRDREAIERQLKDELETRRMVYEISRAEFRNIMSDIPSGLPHPDGTARIKNAGASYNFAVQAYTEALREFNAFITMGVIPERLNLYSKQS